LQVVIILVISSIYATCKCNAIGTLGITPNDERMRYVGCPGGHISNYGGTLNSDTNSKQLEKEEALEIIAGFWQETQLTH